MNKHINNACKNTNHTEPDMGQMGKEREVFGVTYDRYMLLQLHQLLVRELRLKSVVEMPSHGAKAAGSLYSIGFAKDGCHVTLVNPEMKMMKGWEFLEMTEKVSTLNDVNVLDTGFESDRFDLAWNFVTWTEHADAPRYLEEMKRISNKYVLLVTCNNFQPGYPWHRFLHRWYGFPWNHGEVRYNHITTVKKMVKSAGMDIAEYGTIDAPGWPDPSGPRDVRLHRRYGSNDPRQNETPDWEVPFLEYVKTGEYPRWMRMLGKWDMFLRKGVWQIPFSHLFYVLGRKKLS